MSIYESSYLVDLLVLLSYLKNGHTGVFPHPPLLDDVGIGVGVSVVDHGVSDSSEEYMIVHHTHKTQLHHLLRKIMSERNSLLDHVHCQVYDYIRSF